MDFLPSPQTFLDICSRPDDIICIPDEYRSTIESTDDHLAVLSLSPYPWIADIGMRGIGRRVRIKAWQETTVGRVGVGRWVGEAKRMNGSGPGVDHQLTGVVVMATNQPTREQRPTPTKFIHIVHFFNFFTLLQPLSFSLSFFIIFRVSSL